MTAPATASEERRRPWWSRIVPAFRPPPRIPGYFGGFATKTVAVWLLSGLSAANSTPAVNNRLRGSQKLWVRPAIPTIHARHSPETDVGYSSPHGDRRGWCRSRQKGREPC